jgi:hypothetical protein
MSKNIEGMIPKGAFIDQILAAFFDVKVLFGEMFIAIMNI